MRRLIGNLYWTSRGFEYRVSSPELATVLNRILIGILVAIVSGVVAWFLIPR